MKMIKNIKFLLPIKNNKIDFEFMECIISELEEERISELEAYLKVTGLSNYELTNDEENAIRDITNKEWKLYNLEQLYGKSTRGKRLKSMDRIPGNIPFVTAGEACEGISGFIGNQVEIFHKNTVTIDMFGSAKFRNYDYGGDDHVAVVHTEELSKNEAIFVTTAIHKTSHNGQFNYGNNFYAKDADNLWIMLPVENGNIDYRFMNTFISAIHKLVIKDVVLYKDRKIECTKRIIRNNDNDTQLLVAEDNDEYKMNNKEE